MTLSVTFYCTTLRQVEQFRAALANFKLYGISVVEQGSAWVYYCSVADPKRLVLFALAHPKITYKIVTAESKMP